MNKCNTCSRDEHKLLLVELIEAAIDAYTYDNIPLYGKHLEKKFYQLLDKVLEKMNHD